jgi:hypothetical protein
MYDNKILKEFSLKCKEREIQYWKWDIESYNRFSKMKKLAEKAGTNTQFYEKHMKRIRDRWPNVKDWD